MFGIIKLVSFIILVLDVMYVALGMAFAYKVNALLALLICIISLAFFLSSFLFGHLQQKRNEKKLERPGLDRLRSETLSKAKNGKLKK